MQTLWQRNKFKQNAVKSENSRISLKNKEITANTIFADGL